MTYSILGRCPDTGMIGGAVTTSSPAVGARCLFVQPGTGAALTQYWTDPRLGPQALDLLAEGLRPAQALDRLMERPHAEVRQLALLSLSGETAHATGARVAEAVACAEGPDCVAIGNILANDGVAKAMVAAFAAAEPPAESPAPLAERLLAALRAGDAAGGEVKPLVSAALKITRADAAFAGLGFADLRADHHADPLSALEEMWQLFAPQALAYETRALNPA